MKKKFLRNLLLSAACFTFAMTNVKAQTNPIKNAFAVLTPAAQANTVNGTFTVLLSDTNDITEISVSLGSEADSTANLVQYSFLYEVTNGLPTGFSYVRNKYTLTLQAGIFPQQNTYFGMAKTKNNSGWSQPHKFIVN